MTCMDTFFPLMGRIKLDQTKRWRLPFGNIQVAYCFLHFILRCPCEVTFLESETKGWLARNRTWLCYCRSTCCHVYAISCCISDDKLCYCWVCAYVLTRTGQKMKKRVKTRQSIAPTSCISTLH